MPLEGYYEHGALESSRAQIHREIFKHLFTYASRPMNDIARDLSFSVKTTTKDARSANNIVVDELTSLVHVGFLEFVPKGLPVAKNSVRINPAVAAELHKFVKSKR